MMVAPACSDAEFIELFKTHGSATKVGKVLGLAMQNVRRRRRNLEQKYNIKLEAHALPKKAQFYKHLSPEEHKANHHLGLLNGQVIVFSDSHFHPGIRTTANKGLLKFIRNLKPKAVVCGGDAFDGASISRHPRIGWEHRPTVLEELKACEERMGEIEEAAGRARLVWTIGNHDGRMSSRLAANVPEFAGVRGFQLKDHFPAWTPAWCCWVNEGTVISHRWRGGTHATYNNVVNSGVNIITGHLHALKWTPFTDFREQVRYGVDSGTLAEPRGPQFQAYLEGKQPNWGSGFVVLTFHDGRMLQPQLVRKWNETHVEYCGQLIDVSDE
jgi:hypothetical protein